MVCIFYLVRGEQVEVCGRVGDYIALAACVKCIGGITKPTRIHTFSPQRLGKNVLGDGLECLNRHASSALKAKWLQC